MPATPRQQSLAHFAAAVLEWRSKGFTQRSINRMLITALELMPDTHPRPLRDAEAVLEIADGRRVA